MERYEAYKNSGVGWVGEIPTSWDEMPVKRVCDVVLGKMLCSEDKGGYQEKPYLRAKNVMWLKVDQDDIKKMWFSSNELSQYRLKAGDLLVSEGGEVGRTCIWNNEIDECYIQNSVHRVRFRTDKDSRYYLYLFYCLGKIGVFDAIVNRISIAHLTKEKLQQVLILKPGYSQQTAIANFLDRKTAEIDALIAQKERLLELYEEEKTAIINHAVTKGLDPNTEFKDSGVEWLGEIPVGWDIVPVKFNLAVPVTDGPHETPEFINDGVPFISAEAIKNDRIDLGKKRGNISWEDHHRYSMKYKPKVGDVYMVKSGATTGNLARVETDIEFNIWSPLAALRPNAAFLSTGFLFFFMKSRTFFTAVELGWNYGTQQNIGMNVIENLRMVRPPLREQIAIVQHIEAETALMPKSPKLNVSSNSKRSTELH